MQPRGGADQGSWRPSDAILGHILENRVDEAYALSWPGPLEIWVPVHDTGGFDRARAPMGSYDFRLDQIKGTTSLHAGNEVHISFDTPALYPRDNTHFTIVYYDLGQREPVDPVWKFKSTDLRKACIPDATHANRWLFVGSRSGLARDRAAKYQLALRDLAASNGWSTQPPMLPAVSTQPLETNTFFKRHFDSAFLEAATGDQVLMAADPDVFGRHRLVFSKSTGRWISLSIHGGTLTGPTNLIQANIHRATFVPHPNHFVLVQHYDGARHAWYEWSWLIPSEEFAKLASGKGAYLLFTTTLNARHVNHWTPYRTPTATVADGLVSALGGRRLRRAA